MKRAMLLVAAGLLVTASAASAQATPEPPKPLEVGAVAPDFELPGATRYGLLQNPVRLSDFKGRTVVLAFFFRARTRG
jgi:hypothetical protein